MMTEHTVSIPMPHRPRRLHPLTAVDLVVEDVPGQRDNQRKLETQRLKDLEEAASLMRRAAEELNRLTGRVVEEVEGAVVDLSLALTKKVLAHDIEGGRYRVERIVESLISRVPEAHRSQSALKLHPDDAELLARELKDSEGGGWESIKLESDAEVARGSFLLQSAHVVMTADWLKSIETLEEVLERDEREAPGS